MPESRPKTIESDTLIVGAGVIGSAVAMHLAARGGPVSGAIRAIDFDLEGSLSSSELNAGGVRATWSQPLNILMSKLTIEYLAREAEAVGYRDCGYLWLYPEERVAFALAARERQLAQGWPVEAWDVPELRRRVPLIDKTEGIAAAVFAPRDGLVNPNRVKNHFREKARADGAIFDDRTLLRSATYEADGRVRLGCERFPAALSPAQKGEIAAGLPPSGSSEQPSERVEYLVRRVVNCAGPWAAQVARILGYSSPAFAQRRQVCIFDCRDADLTRYGMIVDTSGVYFHPEATNGLAGFANMDEPHGVNFDYDGDAFFMERIWPALYERSTAFERLKHLTGWAGLYEVSPDESAILGAVETGEPARFRGRVFEAHSFSGHGVMHSYAAGLALVELMLDGDYRSFDAGALSAARFDSGRELRETLII